MPIYKADAIIRFLFRLSIIFLLYFKSYYIMMKCLLLVLFKFFVFVPMVIFSQNAATSIGAYCGGGISNTHSFLSPGFGKTCGISAQYKLNDNFSVVSGIAYEFKEARHHIYAMDTIGELLFNLDLKHQYEFITLPILVRYSFGNNQNIRFFINAGSYAAFLLKQNLWSFDLEDNSTSVQSNLDNYKRIGAGISFGGGMSFAFKESLSMEVQLLNNMDITNFNKIFLSTLKTKACHLTIGFTYWL
jgi:hypothetical protein